MKKKYLYWKEYYTEEWLSRYNGIKDLLSQVDYDIPNMYNRFRKFYYSSIKLIQLYLSNNGSPYDNNVEIIRIAFRFCFLDDGDTWMIINDIMENPRKYTVEDFIKNCLNNNFVIFDDLHTKFEELLKVDR